MGLSAIARTEVACYHCGEPCLTTVLRFDEKDFCCQGCQAVYSILKQNELCSYYRITKNPGVSQQKAVMNTFYDFLDETHVQEKLIHYKNGNQCHVKFTIPQMHCSSCIWLLENLNRLHAGIGSSRVVFLERELNIEFNQEEISLKEIVHLLRKIGYEPRLSFDDLHKKQDKKYNRVQILKIAIAGFCFGNIMMLSLPDYFASGNFFNETFLNTLFNYLSLVLSLPVIFYCASEFFVSSLQVLKQKQINIDVPIALAIAIAFGVSLFQIIGYNRLGYLDSMSGIVFFMLLGRYFQNKSYNYLSFKKNFSSFLPIAVNKYENGIERNIPLSDIQIGDEMIIRHQEIVPADGLLMQESGWFDYSFVSGESNWIQKHQGEMIYAGAIQKSSSCRIMVSKSPSQSYITGLWNSRQSEKYRSNTLLTTEKINLYFSGIVLSLGTLACMYWISQGMYQTGFMSLISVWIVACPCALLLCSTFTYGNMLHILAQNGLFIKNAAVLEKIRNVDTLVFDKTGTLTNTHRSRVDFVGRELRASEWKAISSVCYHSIHPLSRAIRNYLNETEIFEVENYQSHEGKGLEARVNGMRVRLGSQQWLQVKPENENRFTKVFLELDGIVAGYFEIKNDYRPGVLDVLGKLKRFFKIHLLSGDNDAEKDFLSAVFQTSEMHFGQLPESKTAYVEYLQKKGHTVMMIGDGLNDAKAFEQSDAGMAIIESENNFLPACDAILKVEKLSFLRELLLFVSRAKVILYICFGISIVYNIIGLSFAMQGLLTPVIAAILMPISTVSIVGLSFLLSRYFAKKIGLQL